MRPKAPRCVPTALLPALQRVPRWITTGLLLCMAALCHTQVAHADTSTPPPQPRPVYVVLAGGAGLGSYEAGYTSTVIQFLREHPEHFVLKGISGTSAGGINAVAGALEYCRVDGESAHTSVNHDAWMPISWQMIYNENRVTREAIFHHGLLTEHGATLLHPEKYALRTDCDVIIQVAATQAMNAAQMKGPTGSASMVEYMGVELRADSHGRAQYHQVPPATDQMPPRVALLADENGIVAPSQVLNMILATAAFPAGFPRVRMTVQEQNLMHPDAPPLVAERIYYDGGIFENVPLRTLAPFLEDEANADALIVVVDLANQRIPPVTNGMRSDDAGITTMAGTWLKYARARDYATATLEFEAQDSKLWLGYQRFPLASEFLSSFAGFLDRSFRETDYALGVHDARLDTRIWQHKNRLSLALPSNGSTAFCVHQTLLGHAPEACDGGLSDNIFTVLRGLLAAGEKRCEAEEFPSMRCAMFLRDVANIDLPKPPISERRERRLRQAQGRAPAADYQAFLEELRFGDFEPELANEWTELRGAKGRRPEILWSRLIEDALRHYAQQQPKPTITSEIAFEALLASALPVLPRPSFSALLNLNGFETTLNLPLSPRFSADLGVTMEWGLQRARDQRWQLFSGGPVARIGWTYTKRQALVAGILDAHAGVLFGPVFPLVASGESGPGDARGNSRPNAAAFIGVAPRFVLLRRLQVDFPIRAYWLCDQPSCTSFASATPAYSIAFRIGWNWTFSPRIRANRSE